MLFTLFLLGGAAHAAAVDATALSLAPTALTVVGPARFDEVSDLVKKGQQQLLKNQVSEALATFEAAHAKSGGKAETDMWVQRARMAGGELDEAFERVLELESTLSNPADASYAIGAGRYLYAKREEAKQGGDPGGAFDEARGYLKDAVDVQPDGYPDAWRMLAESARWVGDSDTAASAVGRALEFTKDAATLTLAAKIRVAQGAGMLGSDDTKEAGLRIIGEGVSNAKSAVKAMGASKDNAVQMADLHLQLGVGQLWLQKKDEAAKAYAGAMGWDPTQVDYGQLFSSFRDEDGTCRPFVEALTDGGAQFERRWGKSSASDATLRWWLGYGQQALGSNDDAIASFEAAVSKFPAFSNSHWYIGRAKYNKGTEHYREAVHHWRTYATVDRAGFLALMKSDPTNPKILEFAGSRLYGQSRGMNNDGIGLEEAADAAELQLLADTGDPRLWNNAGLFHRDAGQAVRQMEGYEPAMSDKEHFERSWETYSKALEMARTSYHLNDAAVLLHYYLERDYDQAIAMYDEAEALAKKRVDEGKLKGDEKGLVEIALRDAVVNRGLLKKKIADALKKDAEEKDAEKKGDGGETPKDGDGQ